MNTVTKTAIAGTILIFALLVFGVSFLAFLNIKNESMESFNIELIFAAVIASAGAITAAFVSYQANYYVECKKDRHQRLQKIDYERAKTRASIVTLHSVASVIDVSIYQRIRTKNESAKHALENKNFILFHIAIKGMPDLPNSFPLVADLDIKFMRSAEQKAVNSIQMYLELIDKSLKSVKMDVHDQELLQAKLGEDTFFSALNHHINQIEHYNKKLWDTITPYLTDRGSEIVPDEDKLRMLLGGDLNSEMPINNLEDAKEEIQKLASRLLRKNFTTQDIRKLLNNVKDSVQDSIKDEDSIPNK